LITTHAVLLGVAFIFGMACGTYWRRSKSARGWGTAAGTLTALMVGGVMFVSVHYVDRFGHRLLTDELRVNAVLLALALVGIVAFADWDPEAERKAADVTRPKKTTGDGTHALLDKLVWMAAVGGFLGGMMYWWRWARMEGLSRHVGLWYYGDFLLAELAMVLVHELGHALTGKALGMRLRGFIVGPFQWRVCDGRWRFQFRPADFLAMGGSTAVVPTDPLQSRRREAWMIAGGPLASLLGGLAALAALLEAPRHAWGHEWQLLALFATFSLIAAVANLVPFQTKKGHYSDGAQIYQLLSGGPWGDYHHAMGIVGSSAVTHLRPRDFDIGAMERASAVITTGARAVHLKLLEFCHYLDCGRLWEATLALNAAEETAEESGAEIPLEFYGDFVFGKAFVQRDEEGTQYWWKRLEAKKPKHFNADYWAARTAYLWMEGRLDEAREAWAQGNTQAEELPKAGAYEFERDKFARLRGELDAQRRVPRWHDDLALTAR
jgi:hypothetical protein